MSVIYERQRHSPRPCGSVRGINRTLAWLFWSLRGRGLGPGAGMWLAGSLWAFSNRGSSCSSASCQNSGREESERWETQKTRKKRFTFGVICSSRGPDLSLLSAKCSVWTVCVCVRCVCGTTLVRMLSLFLPLQLIDMLSSWGFQNSTSCKKKETG